MNEQRRRLLSAGAGAWLAASASGAAAAAPAAKSVAGKPGEFDWLSGEWKIAHRRLKAPGQWDEFAGEATCWSILGGVGHVEELRIPQRDFSGMGLRLLDLGKGVWSDYWVNAKSGVLGGEAGLTGGFVDGAGVFLADDEEAGKPIKVRGLWDEITGRSHRWSQSVSRDGGRTWEDNWVMRWVKV